MPNYDYYIHKLLEPTEIIGNGKRYKPLPKAEGMPEECTEQICKDNQAYLTMKDEEKGKEQDEYLKRNNI